MQYRVLATDYDETLAHEGSLDLHTLSTLRKLKESNRTLVLVTGRILSDLLTVCPHTGIFDRVVAENGATLYDPVTQQERVLATAPPLELISTLKQKQVPLHVGRVVLSSVEPHEKTIVRIIKDLGLEHHIIFNKGSIMILPSGVNKATGLAEALKELGLTADLTAGVGDGENDHAMLEMCGYGVAVQNAVESLKARAKWVTPSARGAGVAELVTRILNSEN
jgi:hydroxymethylpyrimidine pyrophosphatase-like HAD family hydrolase